MKMEPSKTPSPANEELWRKILFLSRGIRDFKCSLGESPWKNVLVKIEEIEEELNLLLTFLQKDEDK